MGSMRYQYHAMHYGAAVQRFQGRGQSHAGNIVRPSGRASLRQMYGDYLELLPQYCGVAGLRGVSCVRPMHGFVPNWHDPLRPLTARLLHVGDAAGNRSALSFAGRAPCGARTVLFPVPVL